jgi:hypothetical protein
MYRITESRISEMRVQPTAEYFLGISKADGKVRLLLDIDRILSAEHVLELTKR